MFLENVKELIKEAFRRGYRFDDENFLINPQGRRLTILYHQRDTYPYFNIKFDGKIKHILYHRFKAYILYGDKLFDEDIEVRHKNNNRLDWSDSNIILGSHSENMMDKPKTTRSRCASNAAKELRKFTEIEIEDIFRKRKNGFTYQEIANDYGCVKSTIFYIIKRLTYKEVCSINSAV